MATFQERFNKLYEKSTLSQKEFGSLFGASTDQVYNWRNGRGEPDTETMKRIATANRVKISWLLGYDEESDDNKNDEVQISEDDLKAIEGFTPFKKSALAVSIVTKKQKEFLDRLNNLPETDQQEFEILLQAKETINKAKNEQSSAVGE